MEATGRRGGKKVDQHGPYVDTYRLHICYRRLFMFPRMFDAGLSNTLTLTPPGLKRRLTRN